MSFPITFPDYRKYGVPSVRSDLPAVQIRRCDNYTNYGDQSDVFGLMHPSIFSWHGVYERDILAPRSKQEVIAYMYISLK